MKKRLIFTAPYEFWKISGGSSNRMFQMLYIYQNKQYFYEILILLDNGKKFLLDDKGSLKSFTGKQNLSTDFLHINYLSSVEKFQNVKRKISIVDLHDDLTERNKKTNLRRSRRLRALCSFFAGHVKHYGAGSPFQNHGLQFQNQVLAP